MQRHGIHLGACSFGCCFAAVQLLLLLGSASSRPLTLSAAAPPSSTSRIVIADVASTVLGTLVLTVQFPGTNQPVAYGQHLRLSTIGQQPTITFNGTTGAFYTVIIVDPDAPVPWNPVASQFVHLWAVNIPGAGPKEPTSSAKGNVIAPYMPPSPPGGTHRYIVMVFEQPSGLKLPTSALTSVNQRVGFNTTKWAQHLKIAAPSAATVFTATAGQ